MILPVWESYEFVLQGSKYKTQKPIRMADGLEFTVYILLNLLIHSNHKYNL